MSSEQEFGRRHLNEGLTSYLDRTIPELFKKNNEL